MNNEQTNLNKPEPSEFLPAGRFTVGANYWASHAGTHMWRDWRPEIVEADFALLSNSGLKVLRVFPLWPDFQPLTQMRGIHGQLREIRNYREALPESSDGVAQIMIDRFRRLADLAGEYELELVIGLITGWMSGRFFAPPALESLNPITDATSVMWQTRMASRLVRELRDHTAISAWDLGNECNCMGQATRSQAWVWTAALTGAIRAADPSRPIVSGMHGLPADPSEAWSIRDQAELTDILTTHPYPFWTPHCDQDPVNSLRPALHAAAETQLYADLGKRPAFAEEIGTMGPMVADEASAAAFIRASLFSLWAHDGRAAFWWCAFDQEHLPYPPYDWVACERELGLMTADGTPKQTAAAIKEANSAISGLPFNTLPARMTEAVCVLTPGQDCWGVAQSTFLLAKQAGLDIKFAFVDEDLPQSSLYLLPSLRGLSSMTRSQANTIMARVHAGATLYLSLDDAVIARFQELFGLEVKVRRRRSEPLRATFEGVAVDLGWHSSSPLQYAVNPTRAEVLGREADGNPIFTRTDYGKGTIYFLAFPLEAEMSIRPGIFQGDQPIWRLYQHIASHATAGRVLRKTNPLIGITEHCVSDTERIAIVINYSQDSVRETMTIASRWRVSEIYRGATPETHRDNLAVDLLGMDAAIWQIRM